MWRKTEDKISTYYNSRHMIDSDISLLGDPFFEEKGKIISRRVLSVEPEVQIEYAIFLNGIMNGNLSVTVITQFSQS
jgi:hypothetical protein